SGVLGVIAFVTFWVLFAATLTFGDGWRSLRRRRLGDWLLDGVGLALQGGVIPLLSATVAYGLWAQLLPSGRGAWHLPAPVAFVLNFVVVDYLYYWNHRLLHRRILWPLHRVHHTVTDLDVVSTARNSVWTPLFIVYLWINSLGAYLLADARPFLLGAA